jgi:hypothetical protein
MCRMPAASRRRKGGSAQKMSSPERTREDTQVRLSPRAHSDSDSSLMQGSRHSIAILRRQSYCLLVAVREYSYTCARPSLCCQARQHPTDNGSLDMGGWLRADLA